MRPALTQSLVVQGDQLASDVPVDLRQEIVRRDSRALRVNSAKLALIVVDKVRGLFLVKIVGVRFDERGDLEGTVSF